MVSGGAGFIGQTLARRLIGSGIDVDVVDDLSGDSLASDPAEGPARLHRFSVQDEAMLADLLRGADAYVHLASSVRIRGGEHDTSHDVQQAYLGTHSALEACHRAGVRRFCLASSASVYGDQPGLRLVETDPLLPVSLYAACKAGAEALVHSYAHLFGMRTTVLRFGNVQGAGLRRGVVADFVDALRRDGTQLTVLGDGRQRKSYLHLDDCISGIVSLGLAEASCMAPADIYNLAANGTLTVVDVAGIVATELGVEPALRFGSGRAGWLGDVPMLELDATRAHLAGWTARRTCREAIVDSARSYFAWVSV